MILSSSDQNQVFSSLSLSRFNMSVREKSGQCDQKFGPKCRRMSTKMAQVVAKMFLKT